MPEVGGWVAAHRQLGRALTSPPDIATLALAAETSLL